MNCRRCNGLMVADVDRESVTGIRCVNCGSDGIIRQRPERIEDDPPEDGCTYYTYDGSRKKRYCGDDRSPGSKHCRAHREQTRKSNAAKAARKPKVRGPAIAFIPMGYGR